MLKANQHIVDKVFVEIGTSSEEEATRIKNNVSTFLREKVFPELELTLDKLSAEGQIYRFDKVDLLISVDQWNDAHSVNNQVEKQLITKIDSVASEFLIGSRAESNSLVRIVNGEETEISSTYNLQKIFLHFLEHAYLPWYGRKEQLDQLLVAKEWDKSFLASLGKLLSKNEAALDRFVLQFSTIHILNFISAFGNVKFQQEKDSIKKIEKLSAPIRNQLLKLLIRVSVHDNTKDRMTEYGELLIARISEGTIQDWSADRILDEHEEWLKKFVEKDTYKKYFLLIKHQRDSVLEFIGRRLQVDPLRKGVTENKRSTIENDPTVISRGISFKTEKEPLFFSSDVSELAVQNAGQVLFHPFLPNLFKHFDWIDEDGMIRENCIDLAVQTLHYCASGQENFFEGNMILEKFLCGLPLEFPLPAESILTQEVKDETELMIKQLISYWPELKNTSPDGLRDMFIKRDGKLVEKDNGHKLIVEPKVQDVLLEKLQWNISIVKMPWSKNLIFVEW